jgi:hypothetical protein
MRQWRSLHVTTNLLAIAVAHVYLQRQMGYAGASERL